jgi:hypothetical protein
MEKKPLFNQFSSSLLETPLFFGNCETWPTLRTSRCKTIEQAAKLPGWLERGNPN